MLQFVIHAPREPITGAVIAVFAKVVRRIGCEISGCGRIECRIGVTCAAMRTWAALLDAGHRFEIINASAVPVVAATYQNAELLVCAESLPYRAIEFAEGAATFDRRVTANSIEIKGRSL